MKLDDFLKVVDAGDMVEISLVDKNYVHKLIPVFCYYNLKEKHGWHGQELMRREAIMKHAIYNIIKDYEVFYFTSSVYDYEYAVIRVTLKVK